MGRGVGGLDVWTPASNIPLPLHLFTSIVCVVSLTWAVKPARGLQGAPEVKTQSL